MKKIFFVIAILVLGTMVGCTKSENKKYIGKYIAQQEATVNWSFTGRKIEVKKAHQILEIKEDSTWELSPRIPGESSDGVWKVDKDGITLYGGKSRIPSYIMRLEKKELIDWRGEIFIKQD